MAWRTSSVAVREAIARSSHSPHRRHHHRRRSRLLSLIIPSSDPNVLKCLCSRTLLPSILVGPVVLLSLSLSSSRHPSSSFIIHSKPRPRCLVGTASQRPFACSLISSLDVPAWPLSLSLYLSRPQAGGAGEAAPDVLPTVAASAPNVFQATSDLRARSFSMADSRRPPPSPPSAFSPPS